jgi:hypothetical protein
MEKIIYAHCSRPACGSHAPSVGFDTKDAAACPRRFRYILEILQAKLLQRVNRWLVSWIGQS